MTDLEQYIKDHYGTCLSGADCACLKPGAAWLGMACSKWQPVPCKTWDELRELVQTVRIERTSSAPQTDAITRSA